MREKLARFMYGRYGNDYYGRFLSILSLVFLFTGMIIGAIAGQSHIVLAVIGSALYYLAVFCMIYSLFRMFSKKIDKRRAENVRYMYFRNKFQTRFSRLKSRITQGRTHRFYRCPKCGATARVPKGKGKIKITCPKCAETFIRKS